VWQAQIHLRAGFQYVVDMDLEKFFDRVRHDKLMGEVR
jgi:RNA-directed DNA polymerase